VDGVGSGHAEQQGDIGEPAVQVEQCTLVAAGDHRPPGPGASSQEGDQVIQESAVGLLQVELDDVRGGRAVPGFGQRRPPEQLPGQPGHGWSRPATSWPRAEITSISITPAP